MNEPTDAALEFAAILGEAIAQAHLSGKQAETTNANVPAAGRDVRDHAGQKIRRHPDDDNIPRDTNLSKAAGS